mgnify:CR=1 FL=1
MALFGCRRSRPGLCLGYSVFFFFLFFALRYVPLISAKKWDGKHDTSWALRIILKFYYLSNKMMLAGIFSSSFVCFLIMSHLVSKLLTCCSTSVTLLIGLGNLYAGGNEYGQCGEEPERKADTGKPVRRDIVIPQRCVPKLTVRQVIYSITCLYNLSSYLGEHPGVFPY